MQNYNQTDEWQIIETDNNMLYKYAGFFWLFCLQYVKYLCDKFLLHSILMAIKNALYFWHNFQLILHEHSSLEYISIYDSSI